MTEQLQTCKKMHNEYVTIEKAVKQAKIAFEKQSAAKLKKSTKKRKLKAKSTKTSEAVIGPTETAVSEI